MMRAGKQTATEKELLQLLEKARDKVPQIRRYAKSTPYEFLKRVELRSSLLVEAGHQTAGGQTVPFYQFRHLTFQEYLAAVAAVEGHYMEYSKKDTVLTPLSKFLTAEEWKEVIPMAAVLARKQAEPLISALVKETSCLRMKIEHGKQLDPEEQWGSHGPKLPSPVERLVQCLIEEAESSPKTLSAALKLTAFFASGCSSKEDWAALSHGPYGAELLHQVWLLYEPMKWSEETDIMSTFYSLASLRQPSAYWGSADGKSELERLLKSQSPEEIVRGIFTCASVQRHCEVNGTKLLSFIDKSVADIEHHLFADATALHVAAAYALTIIWHYDKHQQLPATSPIVLNKLLTLRLHAIHNSATKWSAWALSMQCHLPRKAWIPNLTDAEAQQIRQFIETAMKAFKTSKAHTPYDDLTLVGDLVVAFHAGTIWSDAELAKRLALAGKASSGLDQIVDSCNAMLEQMGKVGLKFLKKQEKQ